MERHYIEFEDIHKSFGKNEVLKGINLGVDKGQLVTLLGPSGCGKSTLLRCLSGLETVTSGRVWLDGNDITDVDPKKRQIGMVFQQYSLFPNMTAAQNVAFGLKIKKLPKPEIDEKVNGVLDVVGLSEQAHQYPSELSGGQQQRVALARAIVMEPKVLLLDEPLSAIDALLRRNLQVEIRRIQKELNITTVFVTHDQDEAMVMSDTIHLFNVGMIEQSGTPLEIYTKPKTKFAATFIGHYNILSGADFSRIVGEKIDVPDVAIRPELVAISRERDEQEGRWAFKGKVTGNTPHGNILRYTLDCAGIPLQADILFDSALFFQEGEEIWLSIKRDDCLYID